MKLLVDTHVLLWSASDPARIARETREAMEDGANELFFSVVSAWEIAIKQSLGKLDLPRPAEQWLPDVVRRTGYQIVEPDLEAALRVRALPWHHRDPFDRLLIAQAMHGGFAIVTHDEAFATYGVPVLRA